MNWLIVAVFAQSGALIYLAWAVYGLRREMSARVVRSSEKLTELAEEQAHEAMKQQRIDQALADFGPPAPKPWPGLGQVSVQPPLTPRTTPRPDRSAEETGAWPYAGDHAWHADETEALPVTPPKPAE